MKAGFLAVTICLVTWATCNAETASNITYEKIYWNGIPAHVVSANLNSPDLKVTVSLAERGAGTSESFSSMISRLEPDAAITGTFFCTRSLLPTGDIVIEGMPIYIGCLGKSVCIRPDNTVEFVPYIEGHKSGWAGFETVLSAGPTLVQDGKVYLILHREGFKDPGLFGKKRRAAIGVTDANKLLLVVVEKPIYMRTLANVMVHIGAVDAVDLDGGSSAALYCHGKRIAQPGRRLTNLLVVYDSLTEYCSHRQALAPEFRNAVLADAEPANDANPFGIGIDKPALRETTGLFKNELEKLIRYREYMTGIRMVTPAAAYEQEIYFWKPDNTIDTGERKSSAVSNTQMDIIPLIPAKITIPASENGQKYKPDRLRKYKAG